MTTDLERTYLNRVISIGLPGMRVVGKVDRITLWEGNVIFIIQDRRFEVDLDYFTENVKLYGNSAGGS